MKKATLVIAVLLLALAHPAQADFVQTFNTGFQNGGVVPDGSLTGWSDTRNVTGAGGAITDVNVTLSLSGGWNGDLYAYLVHNSGFAVLLNRVGRATGNPTGYGDAGTGPSGVTLSLDGTPLPPLGRSGEVVRDLVLPPVRRDSSASGAALAVPAR